MERRVAAGAKGKNKNKSRCGAQGADSKWCAAVHARLKRFLRSADTRVPFELLGPLANREQERFATDLCGTVYRVPWRLVTVGKARFVSVSRPASQQQQEKREVGVSVALAGLVVADKDAGTAADKQQRGKELLGLESTERAARQLAAKGVVVVADDEEEEGARAQEEVVGEEETPLWERDDDNVGLGMLERMGWVQGTGLGKQEQGAVEPLRAVVKNNRAGLGTPSSKAKRAPARRAKAPAKASAKGTPPRQTSKQNQRDRQQGRDSKHTH